MFNPRSLIRASRPRNFMAAPGEEVQDEGFSEQANPAPRVGIPWKMQAAFPQQQQGFAGKGMMNNQMNNQMMNDQINGGLGQTMGRAFGNTMQDTFKNLFSKYRR